MLFKFLVSGRKAQTAKIIYTFQAYPGNNYKFYVQSLSENDFQPKGQYRVERSFIRTQASAAVVAGAINLSKSKIYSRVLYCIAMMVFMPCK